MNITGFNHKWAKAHTKKQFVDQHKHLHSVEELEAEYDKIVPPKEKKGSEPVAKEPEKE